MDATLVNNNTLTYRPYKKVVGNNAITDRPYKTINRPCKSILQKPIFCHSSTSTSGKGETPTTLARRACTQVLKFIIINHSSVQKDNKNRNRTAKVPTCNSGYTQGGLSFIPKLSNSIKHSSYFLT